MESKSMSHYARLSDLAYVKGTNKKKRDYLSQNNLGYDLDSNLSDKHHVVVTSKDDPTKAVVSIRGTQDSKDLGTDLALVLGLEKLTPRYRNANKKMDKIIEKYGKENVIITGHSLGSSIGSHLAKKHDVEAHLFNTGSSPHLTTAQVAERLADRARRRENEINYYNVSHDPLSQGTSYLVGEGDRHHFVDQKESTPHTITNFF